MVQSRHRRLQRRRHALQLRGFRDRRPAGCCLGPSGLPATSGL